MDLLIFESDGPLAERFIRERRPTHNSMNAPVGREASTIFVRSKIGSTRTPSLVITMAATGRLLAPPPPPEPPPVGLPFSSTGPLPDPIPIPMAISEQEMTVVSPLTTGCPNTASALAVVTN